MKRPKKEKPPLTPETAKQELQDQYDQIHSWLALNVEHDPTTLGYLIALNSDQILAIDTHGTKLDHDIIRIDNRHAYLDYTRLWAETTRKMETIQKKIGKNRIDRGPLLEKEQELADHRVRIAWRIWQCQTLNPGLITAHDLYQAMHRYFRTGEPVA